MTVYARGYLPYEGGFGGAHPAWVVFREAYRSAMSIRAMKRIRILFLCCLFGFAATLYIGVGMKDWTEWIGVSSETPAHYSWEFLREVVEKFYVVMVILAVLVAILGGAGLVSDDLRVRALPLYLVRPIRPFEYALGKALVLPALLLFVTLLPGPLFLLLVALWQPPGETWDFLRDHGDLAKVCLQSYLLASAGYGGLMLFLSSRTPRRSAVLGLAAAVVFGGVMLALMAGHMRSTTGDVLRVLGIPSNTLFPILRLTRAGNLRMQRLEEKELLPDPTWAAVVCVALLVVGFTATWRRARSVEVAG